MHERLCYYAMFGERAAHRLRPTFHRDFAYIAPDAAGFYAIAISAWGDVGATVKDHSADKQPPFVSPT